MNVPHHLRSSLIKWISKRLRDECGDSSDAVSKNIMNVLRNDTKDKIKMKTMIVCSWRNIPPILIPLRRICSRQLSRDRLWMWKMIQGIRMIVIEMTEEDDTRANDREVRNDREEEERRRERRGG